MFGKDSAFRVLAQAKLPERYCRPWKALANPTGCSREGACWGQSHPWRVGFGWPTQTLRGQFNQLSDSCRSLCSDP